eukprot:Pompholyxophrys_sp_v1_NODE_29_length_3693_cov_2.397746.p4 type:complete len:111 gc:universal NODE_29_length_3693_cov_2.397746:3517-3185(-)
MRFMSSNGNYMHVHVYLNSSGFNKRTQHNCVRMEKRKARDRVRKAEERHQFKLAQEKLCSLKNQIEGLVVENAKLLEETKILVDALQHSNCLKQNIEEEVEIDHVEKKTT